MFGGNLDLSVVMTFISTFSAFFMMPLWMFCLGKTLNFSVADPDLGSRCLFDPRIWDPVPWYRFFPDPGSQTYIFESLLTILGPNFFYASSKIK
jgi:hypothetical protein